MMYKDLYISSLDELLNLFRKLPQEEEDNNLYDEIALQIRNKDLLGSNVLFDLFDEVTNPQQKASILFALSANPTSFGDLALPTIDQTRVVSLIEDSLRADDDTLVAEAIDSATTLQLHLLQEEIKCLYGHISPYVKGSVLRYTIKISPHTAFNLLLEALQDVHYIVRENAVDELCNLVLTEQETIEAIAHLERMRVDEHPHVREAVESALSELKL